MTKLIFSIYELILLLEERKAKIKEKESERKSALELIQCSIQFGTESQKQMGTQLLTQKLEMLKQKLDDEQMKQDLDSLGIGEEITTDPAMEQV